MLLKWRQKLHETTNQGIEMITEFSLHLGSKLTALSLFVYFHLGWEGDCVGFLHYQQGR